MPILLHHTIHLPVVCIDAPTTQHTITAGLTCSDGMVGTCGGTNQADGVSVTYDCSGFSGHEYTGGPFVVSCNASENTWNSAPVVPACSGMC